MGLQRTALVIGGSSGIGLAVVEALVRNGVRVAVGHHPSEQPQGLPAELVAPTDISNEDDVEALYDKVEEFFGGLDIVVNAAGVARYAPTERATLEDFDLVFGVNARGTFISLRRAARTLRDGGRIVNLSSGSAQAAAPLTAIYAGSKAAIEQFTRTLATELAGRSITVNAVAPGFTDTPMLRSSLHIPREVAANLSPFKRLGEPAEVAAAVAFLCSPEAGWLTGQTIQAGGGVVMS